MKLNNIKNVMFLLALIGMQSCGQIVDFADTTTTGGMTTATGGKSTAATGGVVALGGSSATGGTLATGGSMTTGGTLSTGGTLATGGSLATGGMSSTGGMSATGGMSSTGGMIATGGSVAINPCAMSLVDLGNASGFAVLGGATVTNTGPTSVTGDLGVSPGSAVTGFGPGIVIGTQHVADPTAANAEASLTVAYNDARGRTLCSVLVAGNLGGMTLTPGLYTSTSSLEISSGDLVLDAQGDANAVFIFQMASTLTTTPGRQVILTGHANAANVFWQVGSSATIGTTSAFVGTIMADQAITLNTGATLVGRVLARIAAVTLDTNVVVKP